MNSRYNLKRRVASLPPISAEIFSEKVLQARAATTAEEDKAYFERSCAACTKTYYSANAYQNHLSSQKHKLNELAASHNRNDDETKSVASSTFSLGEPTTQETTKAGVESDADEEFNMVIEGLQKSKLGGASGGRGEQQPSPIKRPGNPQQATADAEEEEEEEEESSQAPTSSVPEPTWTLGSCIFCNFESESSELNAQHMERTHGMFIPEKTYLVNLDGLIEQLQTKIGKDNQCIFCDKMKANVYAVQTHMRDIGHCMIPYTSEHDQLAIGDFYDFRSTYSDGEEESESDSEADGEPQGARIPKVGAKDKKKPKGDDEDADGWETDSSESSLDSEDLTAVPAEGHYHQFERLSKHAHHSRDDARPRHQADGFHSRAHKHTHAVFYDECELHLPTGKSVGHRSLNKYYRQNLTSYPTPAERAERLAIEDADHSDAGSDRGKRKTRAVVPRNTAGLAGVSDYKKQLARKDEQRGRKKEAFDVKKRDLAYGVSKNNQQAYYYRYDGGG